MKLTNKILAFAALLALVSCGLDNRDAPNIMLTGSVVNKADNKVIQVANGNDDGRIRLQFYQRGYDLHNSFSVYVNADGKFSATVFAGKYQVIHQDTRGPWVNTRDTVEMDVTSSNHEFNYPVDAYYTVDAGNFSLSGDVVTASCNYVQSVIGVNAQPVEWVRLYVGVTAFADQNYSEARADAAPFSTGSGSASATLTLNNATKDKMAKKGNSLYARLGIKIAGKNDLLYTPIVKLQ